ncbi:glutaredoxin-like protein, partial [Ectothiorhodospira sp. PHS-1]
MRGTEVFLSRRLKRWGRRHGQRFHVLPEPTVDALDRIRQQVEENPVIIYMKGTPQFPMCGFSNRAATALKACGAPFAYVNILADQEIMQALP